MSVTELRPRASTTFVCPCGSQWFTRKFQFDTKGAQIAKQDHFECADGCGRKHPLTPAVIAAAKPLGRKP